MIEEFKDKIKSLKNILNEIKKLESLKELEINEIKTKLNMLDDETTNLLEKLKVDLTTLEVREKILEKPMTLKRKYVCFREPSMKK